MKALLAMLPELEDLLFDHSDQRRLRLLLDFPSPHLTENFGDVSKDVLSQVEVLITGWGSPGVDASVLAAMPQLQLIVHAAGSVKSHLVDEVWKRGVRVISCADANATPVVEYSLAMILLAGKSIFRSHRDYSRFRSSYTLPLGGLKTGNNRKVVGIVGASRIGRRVLQQLSFFDFETLVYDPFLTEAEAGKLGATLCTLDEIARGSEIVSIHAPLLPTTRGMISRAFLSRMQTDATIINTARGDLLDQEALIDELKRGRINAILDVTTPEVLPDNHPLFTLDNVLVTPHVAGARGNEIRRIGRFAVEQIERFVRGEPSQAEVCADQLRQLA